MTQKDSVDRFRRLLRSYYKTADSGANKEHECKGRANGFAEALLMTTPLTENEIDKIVEKEHLDFFGITREKRFYATANSAGQWVERNWDKFDQPTYARRPLRCKKKTKSPVQITNTS